MNEQEVADAGARLEEATHKRNSSRTITVRRRKANAKLLSS